MKRVMANAWGQGVNAARGHAEHGGMKKFMHEFGHCIGIYSSDQDLDGDFVLDPNEDENRDEFERDPITDIPKGPDTVMNWQYLYHELSTEKTYETWVSPNGLTTAQRQFTGGESCWETFFNKYNSIDGQFCKGIEFDLDHNGMIDSDFNENYEARSCGPYYKDFLVGDSMSYNLRNIG